MRTKQTDESLADFLAGVEDDRRRKDCEAVLGLMRAVTGEEPKLWGGSMIGFGSYHYVYDSGRDTHG